ncbi:MAG: ABC transporter ATP-binding protein [Desulfobacteraceae bacterium]|jgi:spermidine/putrescine ABC transporter ATP-binding subunit|nr:ABC transporter ATP-binding protein [Desulfobacteraceae bacterium]
MTPKQPIIRIQNVTKIFKRTITAVKDVSLDIAEGEFFALLGPSGCGKTTLLRMLAGFENPTSGRIVVDGQDMEGVAPNHRPVNMVFQSYAVFPHMTVAKNVAYGLKVTGMPEKEIKKLVPEALELVKLVGFEHRMPSQLSGGQQQRVALARALVKKPKVLLLDEPLSALDAKLREAMQIELVNLQKSVGITFMIVTHSQAEALSTADRIAVMEDGQVMQVAGPLELYENPSSKFCADFIGKINRLRAAVVGVKGDSLVMDIEGIGKALIPHDEPVPSEVTLAVRPEKLQLDVTEPGDGCIKFKSRVANVVYYGSTSHVFLENIAGEQMMAEIRNRESGTAASIRIGSDVWVSWQSADTLVLIK